MKKIVVGALVAVILVIVYSIFTMEKPEEPVDVYRFDFDEEIDRSFWLVSPWEQYKRDYGLVNIRDGILRLSGDITGQMPYMLSMPIEVEEGDVIVFKRRVRLKHGVESFAGGISMYQTDATELIPEKTDGSWTTGFGDGVYLVEYSYDLTNKQERPGRDIFRFLAADWSYNDNFVLISPVYDTWFDEEVTFDTRSSQMFYSIDGKAYKLNSYELDKDSVRFMMHPFGLGSGHLVEVDWVEIRIEHKREK